MPSLEKNTNDSQTTFQKVYRFDRTSEKTDFKLKVLIALMNNRAEVIDPRLIKVGEVKEYSKEEYLLVGADCTYYEEAQVTYNGIKWEPFKTKEVQKNRYYIVKNDDKAGYINNGSDKKYTQITECDQKPKSQPNPTALKEAILGIEEAWISDSNYDYPVDSQYRRSEKQYCKIDRSTLEISCVVAPLFSIEVEYEGQKYTVKERERGVLLDSSIPKLKDEKIKNEIEAYENELHKYEPLQKKLDKPGLYWTLFALGLIGSGIGFGALPEADSPTFVLVFALIHLVLFLIGTGIMVFCKILDKKQKGIKGRAPKCTEENIRAAFKEKLEIEGIHGSYDTLKDLK